MLRKTINKYVISLRQLADRNDVWCFAQAHLFLILWNQESLFSARAIPAEVKLPKDTSATLRKTKQTFTVQGLKHMESIQEQ